jgi:hypothetical protein
MKWPFSKKKEKDYNCDHCHNCISANIRRNNLTLTNMPFHYTIMILCPSCGNKRCPKANHHANRCTGSNDSGQLGSAYP